MRPPELLELRRAHEGTAEGVVEMEEDGIEGSKATITGKPRVKEMGERYHPEIEINLATGVSTE